MVQPAARGPTYEDILALPREITGQIVFGVLHTHSRPGPKHLQVATTLGEELGPAFKRGRGGPGGWILLDEPELHLAPHIVVPDLAGWRRETMPELPIDKPYFVQAPDWVCEVLSPSTAALDRGDKLSIYATNRVTHVWFIDPEAKTLEVLTLDGPSYRVTGVHSGDAKVRAVPFDAVELALAVLWLR